MLRLKSCPRCRGDMMVEELLGDVEVVCLQCGYRADPRVRTHHALDAIPLKKVA